MMHGDMNYHAIFDTYELTSCQNITVNIEKLHDH